MADPECQQAQIKVAIPFKDLKVKHTHACHCEAGDKKGGTTERPRI